MYDEYLTAMMNDQVLAYHTTNRSGYREYKSCGIVCEGCLYLKQCTESRDHVKVVTRHIWEPYMEKCEDIRHTIGMKEVYAQRKETVSSEQQRKPRIPLYTDDRKSPDGNESRAYVCLHICLARKGKRGAQKSSTHF